MELDNRKAESSAKKPLIDLSGFLYCLFFNFHQNQYSTEQKNGTGSC
jgi:hypothetical protein